MEDASIEITRLWYLSPQQFADFMSIKDRMDAAKINRIKMLSIHYNQKDQKSNLVILFPPPPERNQFDIHLEGLVLITD